MNKKIYSFAMMALLALGSATPLVAQETEEVVAEEAAAQPEKFQGLQFDVPALDPKHQAVCDEYMNSMFTDPERTFLRKLELIVMVLISMRLAAKEQFRLIIA